MSFDDLARQSPLTQGLLSQVVSPHVHSFFKLSPTLPNRSWNDTRLVYAIRGRCRHDASCLIWLHAGGSKETTPLLGTGVGRCLRNLSIPIQLRLGGSTKTSLGTFYSIFLTTVIFILGGMRGAVFR